MLRIAICDDSEVIRKETNSLLLKYSMQKDIEFSTEEFADGESLLCENDSFDLIILDYDFEEGRANGLEIAKELRKRRLDTTIIFLTSYSKVVFDVFEVSTFRFLVKPVEEEKLFSALDDFVRNLQEDDTLVVKVDGVFNYIRESQIAYLEGDGKNCIINYISEKEPIKCHETMANVEARLSDQRFFRCHKSFVVNMDYVDSFSKTDLKLQNDSMIMISRNRYKPFYEAYTNYITS